MKLIVTPHMRAINEFFADLDNWYYVGGCVRDLLIGKEPHDYDLTTGHTPEEVEAYIKSKGRRVFKVGAKFGTLGVKIAGQVIEMTTFRGEVYKPGDRKPEVTWGTSINEDLKRRDFTINSMACRPDGRLIDPFKGRQAYKDRQLVAVGSPKKRFHEDPLRLLRALRFAAKYNLKIEEKTWEKLKHCRFDLLTLSKERIVDEMTKMLLLEPDALNRALRLIWNSQSFQVTFPEMQLQLNFDQQSRYHSYDLHEHTIMVVVDTRRGLAEKGMSEEEMIPYLWAALLHDIAKPFVQTWHKSMTYCNYIHHEILGADIVERHLTHYKFSNKHRRFIVSTIKDHLKDDCWLREYDNMRKVKP